MPPTAMPDAPMQRVLVSGISGAGKTTLARRIEARLGLPHTELDSLFHGPGWQPRSEFEADVEAFSTQPAWVTEDQYHTFIGDRLWRRADTVVWLDLPRHVVMRRVVWRTFSRMAMRTELYNGNREQLSSLRDPGHPIRWSWTQHADRRRRIVELAESHPDVRVVRLRTPRQVRAWERGLGSRVAATS